MGKRPPELSPAEWTLMNAVWKRGRSTVRELLEAVVDETDWAYSTVKTLLERMEAKGLLTVTRVGPVKQYAARRRKRDVVPKAIEGFLERVMDDDSCAPVVQYLARKRGLTADEVSELERILRRGEDA